MDLIMVWLFFAWEMVTQKNLFIWERVGSRMVGFLLDGILLFVVMLALLDGIWFSCCWWFIFKVLFWWQEFDGLLSKEFQMPQIVIKNSSIEICQMHLQKKNTFKTPNSGAFQRLCKPFYFRGIWNSLHQIENLEKSRDKVGIPK